MFYSAYKSRIMLRSCNECMIGPVRLCVGQDRDDEEVEGGGHLLAMEGAEVCWPLGVFLALRREVPREKLCASTWILESDVRRALA